MLHLGANDPPSAVHKEAVAIDDIGFGVLLSCARNSMQPAGKVVVVSIQPAHQVAGGAQEPLVDSV